MEENASLRLTQASTREDVQFSVFLSGRCAVYILQCGGESSHVHSSAANHLEAGCRAIGCWSLLQVITCTMRRHECLLCGQRLQAVPELKKQQRRLEQKQRGHLTGRGKAQQHFHLVFKGFNFNAHNHGTKHWIAAHRSLWGVLHF